MRKSKQPLNRIDTRHIISRNNHSVSKTDISPNALKVLNRLSSSGHEAYLVGGSVRDLLLHKSPKDFDVATGATPNQVKQLFRNARIIGRRFKLVHILYYREIIEVATFRGADKTETQVNHHGMVTQDNVYGTLEEDAWRRDFTVNSLYYNIADSTIIDFTGGVKDIQERQIRIIGHPQTRYQEDPVRMLRAIRFSAKLHFDIASETATGIHQLNHLIAQVSSSRLFEEMLKLYHCGEAETAHRLLEKYGLYQHLFPQLTKLLDSSYPINALTVFALENTDSRIRENKPVTPAFIYAILLWFPMVSRAEQLRQDGVDPLPALEQAMSLVIAEQNKVITIPKRHSQIIREIWLLQYRFARRTGNRAQHLLMHPRFRAAYDFLALRAFAGDESMALVEWWTTYQDADEATQAKMVAACSTPSAKKTKRKK